MRALEDEPLLNAGTGAYLQADGVARLDASLMASDGRAGAVAQVPLLRHPVSLARYLLEQDAHVMLAGPEALTLAARLGHEVGVVATPAKIAYWQEHLDDACRRLDYAAMADAWKRGEPAARDRRRVAVDAEGRLAAAHLDRRHRPVLPRPRRRHARHRRRHLLHAARRRLDDRGRRAHPRQARGEAPRATSWATGVPLEQAARRVLEEVGPGAGLDRLGADGAIVRTRNTPFMAAAQRG